MDPGIDSEWLVYKNDHIEEVPNIGNVARSWQWRERGIEPQNYPSNKTVLENAAEDILVQKPLKIRCCDLPGYPRSTFLMVFSPDGTKVASTHGNHNIYVSELASGKHVRILKGHPRTPWCIAFHPSHPQLIGSGCLGGQVRVWDISSGGSEVWNVRNETVIASIAFHPREQLLVIATHNELYFWDWNQSAPFTKVTTNNVNEKVRYVAFDALGYKLITGISLWASPNTPNASLVQQNTPSPTNNVNPFRRDDADDPNGPNRPQQDNSGSAQEMIVNSYQNLVQRYDSLVRNYQRLYMVRHRLTTTPPPPPNTIDRGTDPMETDPSPAGVTRRPTSNAQQNDAENPVAGTSRSRDSADNGDSGANSSRLLNLDVLSLGNSSSRNQNSSQEDQSTFGSRASAFQPLSDYAGRSFQTVDQNERITRLLPNPFSSTNNHERSTRANSQPTDNPTNSSRTSIFTSTRPELSLNPDDVPRRSHRSLSSQPLTSSLRRETMPITLEELTPITRWPPPSHSNPSSSQRPTMTNSSTQMSPVSAPVEARTINESLDLIRDILRDSGTRLLNLITNMSIATLANMERNSPRRGSSGPAPSNENSETRPRVRLFATQAPRDIASTSDSDSDQSLELNIFRTPNSNFRENEARDQNVPATTPNERTQQPTDRMTFELNEDTANETGTNGINVSASSSRFHVRTQRNAAGEGPSTSTKERPGTSDNRNQSAFRHNVSFTSRDTSRTRGNVVPPREIYTKVKAAVNALQRHTLILTNLWLHGHRISMSQLRNMWDNLRRRVLMLQRQTGHLDVPSQYTRSLLDRCMLLTQMSENLRGSYRSTGRSRTENTETDNRNQNQSQTTNSGTSNENEQTPPRETERAARQSPATRSSTRRSPLFTRSSLHPRRRLQPSHRWWLEDELRRRIRSPAINHLTQRYANRPRRDFARALEISATRHEIRMRAMQVLSVMFSMMMMCLEERGLSHVIISMLRTLKKALALTCLMLMSNRNNNRNENASSQQTSRMEALNVVRIEHIEHVGHINVDDPDESSNSLTSGSEEEPLRNVFVLAQIPLQRSATPPTDNATSHSSETSALDQGSAPQFSSVQETSISLSASSQRWSNRLAVQIAAANRNNSITANNRRKIYLERKRQKALHKTNPLAHPLNKKKLFPPVSSHRIPALRCLPRKPLTTKVSSPRNDSSNVEPVPGPSSLAPGAETANQDSPRNELPNDLEHRVNLIRLAHLQAVRMRNAARYRRLETIRVFTPSSVREMFALQSNNPDNPTSNQPAQPNTSDGNRPPYLPPILTFRADSNDRPSDEPNQFHTVSNNAPMPLVQINDLPISFDPSSSQSQRLPRIHEYLQPIILAQNAMVVEEDSNGGNGGGGGGGGGGNGAGEIGGGRYLGARRMSGMAGLLDAGIISEAMPAPSHRVQAWDFTAGVTPDIADSTKNVVVQRCRIHNDASIDISKDGRLLVALLPVPRFRNTNHWLGVYSLEWSRLGHCLHTAVLEQSAVSVALSPTARHLAVGLGSRRFTTTPHARNNVFALLYRLEPLENTSRTGLSPIKELEQNWEHGFTSLNCLRWAPQPGQGLVYANNTGQLIIMS
ncbi:serine-rich adhesin for platelets-like isoform X2 [Battus philenor]|uniref:serine-rich adhesin for platelets-like isoform X2 n=1 Tax=Battus philenor TaxID=42288 RepID=UPI0035CF7242